MALARGDVVLVRFPFTSGTGAKLRPALVVQADSNNRRLTNTILAPLTTTTHRSAEPTQLALEAKSEAGKAAGIRRSSVVSCENLATVEQSLVLRRLGKLPPDAMQKVNQCLKAALGIV